MKINTCIRYLLTLGILISGLFVEAKESPRKVDPFNSGWMFTKSSSDDIQSITSLKTWEAVNVPHTWNAYDVMDDTPGYYRGSGVYKKVINPNIGQKNKRLFLQFEAAGQEAVLYINKNKIAEHKGGYTQFIVPLSEHLIYSQENEIVLVVSNRYNENLPPLSADFTFFGGLYRNVSLIETRDVYFGDHAYGANGVYVSTPKVNAESADVNVVAQVINTSDKAKSMLLKSFVYNSNQELVAEQMSYVKLFPKQIKKISQEIAGIANPALWSPEHPSLYAVKTQLLEETGEIYDEITNPLAFRWFSFDAEKGFFLNGKHLKLIGASRHQDYKNMGNAVPDRLQIKDVVLLKEMGGNFLRVAHYPQSKAVLDACDSLGILTSIEIPIVNEITESEEFTQNSLQMQTEMIRQYYNHPSVIMWAYMNEVLLRPKFGNDKERQKLYFENIRILAQNLEDLTRKEDPTRYTMIAHHGAFDLYNRVGLNNIAMVVGWNLYQGWYGGTIAEFGKQLDNIHKNLKDKPLLVTEYGADVDPRINTSKPIRFDKSIEYGMEYHLGYIKDIMERPFVAGAMAWNLSDFSSETREETMPHINNKGLLTLDRKEKDTYWLYKVKFNERPLLKISNWNNRAAVSKESTSEQDITVIANVSKVEVLVNGISIGEQDVESNIAGWKAGLFNGKNSIVAKADIDGKIYTDSTTIQLNLIPHSLKKYDFDKPLLISFGDIRSYTDTLNNVWIPEKEYEKRSWGFVGGKILYKENSPRQKYGIDKNIINTEEDPLYQTQRIGVKQLIFDVPRGTYEVELLFAEYNDEQTKLLYNLTDNGGESSSQNIGENVFSIKVNGKNVFDGINVAKEKGYFTAVQKKATVKSSSKGLVLDFEPLQGESIINAIKISKIK